MQEQADVIVIYFGPDTDAPISLLEFGLSARSGKAIVACHQKYKKRKRPDSMPEARVQFLDSAHELNRRSAGQVGSGRAEITGHGADGGANRARFESICMPGRWVIVATGAPPLRSFIGDVILSSKQEIHHIYWLRSSGDLSWRDFVLSVNQLQEQAG